MKLKMVLMAMAVLLLAVSSTQAQVSVFPACGGGVVVESGEKPAFSALTGFNMPLFKDDSTGLMFYNRFQYYYTNKINSDDGQGFVNFLCCRRGLNFIGGVFTNVHVDLGGGLVVEMTDQANYKYGIIKMEIGVDLWKSIGVAVACDYQPGGVYEKDVWFPHVMLDLTPGLGL